MAAEDSRASAAPGYVAHHDVTLSGFVTMGLDIEEEQYVLLAIHLSSTNVCIRDYRLRVHKDAKAVSPSKLPALVQRRHALRRRIIKFRDLQAVYMPAALAVLSQDPTCRCDVEDVENGRLGLPSGISAVHRSQVCSSAVQQSESRVREPQARDALQDLRRQFHTIAHLLSYKQREARHQGANTRARAEIAKHEKRKERAVERYRRARSALLALRGSGNWERELRELRDDDIRHLQEDDEKTKKKKRKRGEVAEGTRTISWIWRGADGDGDAGATESLRIEWATSRARTARWREETKYGPEEMRRFLETLAYEEQVWYARATKREVDDIHLREGLVAYALDQARIRRNIRATFREVCLDTARDAGGGVGDAWRPVEGFDSSVIELPEVDEEYQDIVQMHALDSEHDALSGYVY